MDMQSNPNPNAKTKARRHCLWGLGPARCNALVAARMVVLTGLVGLTVTACGPGLQQELSDTGSQNTDTDADTASEFAFSEDTEDPNVAELPYVLELLLARPLPGAQPDELEAAYSAAGVTLVDSIPEIDTVAVAVGPERFKAAAAALSRQEVIESVHKSYEYSVEETPNDRDFRSESWLDVIRAREAWDVTVGDDGVVIAVLDTGIQPDHPDLAGKLIAGRNIPDDDGDTADVLGHGTSVAGCAAALSDNGEGIAGVAWDSPIMPVRISDERGRATSRNIAKGIIWAVDHGAKVINISFAPLSSDRTVLNAAGYARASGRLVTIASGNDGRQFGSRSNADALFVAAVDDRGGLASFSNTGAYVDLAAPGVGVYTTADDSGYRSVNGTSFSSPIVAGVAALILSVNPDLRPTTVADILMTTAVDLGDRGRDDSYGHGLVDAAAAVAAALDANEETDEDAPEVDIISPKDDTRVSRRVTVSVGAYDAVGVVDTVLSLDGIPYATDTSSPFRFSVSVSGLPDGVHTLSVVATDESGNASRAASVRIIVGGSGSSGSSGGVDTVDPEVVINFPVDGTRVTDDVAVGATATDNRSLRTIEWLVDGRREDSERVSGTRAEVSWVWNASQASRGTHRVTVRATDSAGNQASTSVELVK